jgi:hypothetical protein
MLGSEGTQCVRHVIYHTSHIRNTKVSDAIRNSDPKKTSSQTTMSLCHPRHNSTSVREETHRKKTARVNAGEAARHVYQQYRM